MNSTALKKQYPTNVSIKPSDINIIDMTTLLFLTQAHKASSDATGHPTKDSNIICG